MIRTIAGLALGAFIVKRVSPSTYEKAVTVLNDAIDIASDITTAAAGQVKAYSCEAAQDAKKRLEAVNPAAIEELRALLDGTQQPQQPTAQRRVAPRHRP